MQGSTFANVLAFAVGALLLTSVLIVWLRQFASLVRLLSVQGFGLALIPLTTGIHDHERALVAVSVVVATVNGVVIPRVVARPMQGADAPRESEPVVNTTASLLAVAFLTAIAFGVSGPVVALDPTPATRAAPVALAVVLIGVFLLVTRRRALSQVVGFLVMTNGIAALAFLTTHGVPLVVELGASLDVLLAVIILQVLSGQLRLEFGRTDLDGLRELHD